MRTKGSKLQYKEPETIIGSATNISAARNMVHNSKRRIVGNTKPETQLGGRKGGGFPVSVRPSGESLGNLQFPRSGVQCPVSGVLWRVLGFVGMKEKVVETKSSPKYFCASLKKK